MEAENQLPHARARVAFNLATILDLAERALLLLILGWFLIRFIPSFSNAPYNVLLAVSESVTVILVLIRKQGTIATSSYAWAVAVVGTCAPLLVTPEGAVLIPIWLGATLMSVGLFLSFSAKLFLNRSFGIVAANRGVKRSGPYRLVRHPMYLGYLITQLAFLLVSMSVWNVVAYAIGWIGLVLRIRIEEAFLSKDAQYRDYAAAVPFRLVPGLY